MHMGEHGTVTRRGGTSGRRARRRGANEEVALQITSMADIFTILLVFLLKSYSVSAIDIDVGKEIKLPVASGGTESVEAMKVQVTETGITLEGKPVLKFEHYKPNSREITSEGTMPELVKAFKREREKQREIASAAVKQGEKPDDAVKRNFDSKLLVIADKKVPYHLLKNVLASASELDFTDFKLVVVNAD